MNPRRLPAIHPVIEGECQADVVRVRVHIAVRDVPRHDRRFRLIRLISLDVAGREAKVFRHTADIPCTGSQQN